LSSRVLIASMMATCRSSTFSIPSPISRLLPYNERDISLSRLWLSRCGRERADLERMLTHLLLRIAIRVSSPPRYSTTKDPPFWPARQMSRFSASDDIGTFSPPLSLAQLSLELHVSSRAQTTQRNPDYRRAPRIRSFRETAVAHFQIAINFSKSGCVGTPG
jgi:hypothetical protein